MAHLWRMADPNEWQPVLLSQDTFDLRTCDAGDRSARPSSGDDAVLVRRLGGAGGEVWALVAAPGSGARVNGWPIDIGLVVLADRDEIRRPLQPPVYFSTERLAAVVPYPVDARGFCPRCKDRIDAGSMAVCCPACGLWHHAADERPCWTYGEQCAACSQPTPLDAGFQWTPQGL